MKQTPTPAPASQREALPMQVDVKIHSLHASGPVLADASVNLNGCFAVRGVKVVDGSNGPFASMPSYKGRDGYRDVCFPCTKEFRQRFQDTVLNAYRQELAQIHGARSYERPRQREKPAFEERAAPGPQEEVPRERPEEAPAGPEEEAHSFGGMAMQ